ncbi:MAG: hypothetical protein KIT44_06875 [Opitutaceae bacterium]|nr:hypothetical protein [Opitutaceae bacterium]
MQTPIEAAVSDALRAGRALCKTISRNDVGATGGHQAGFYLPKSVWRMFSTKPPVDGSNHKTLVQIQWPEGIRTVSAITWYGTGTRSEFRLTRFGKSFPWLHESYVGSLLVLVPITLRDFKAHVLETEEDIEFLLTSLGIETLGGWGVFSGGKAKPETEDECLDRIFKKAIASLENFPPGQWMAAQARSAAEECVGDLTKKSADSRLLKWITSEYQLFRALEQKLTLPIIQKPYKDVDSFINVAATVMNRRKSRAGHSLEHHVEKLLLDEGLPFDRQPRIDGKVRPDLLIPGKAAYEDSKFPVSGLIVVGLKTTCKDRWRQILNEGHRVPEKHLFTLQEAISSDQLHEMKKANVTLVVPKNFHTGYDVTTGIRLLTVDGFLQKVRKVTKNLAA